MTTGDIGRIKLESHSEHGGGGCQQWESHKGDCLLLACLLYIGLYSRPSWVNNASCPLRVCASQVFCANDDTYSKKLHTCDFFYQTKSERGGRENKRVEAWLWPGERGGRQMREIVRRYRNVSFSTNARRGPYARERNMSYNNRQSSRPNHAVGYTTRGDRS